MYTFNVRIIDKYKNLTPIMFTDINLEPRTALLVLLLPVLFNYYSRQRPRLTTFYSLYSCF